MRGVKCKVSQLFDSYPDPCILTFSQWYDDAGKPIVGDGCRQRHTCTYAHPGEPEWESSRRRLYAHPVHIFFSQKFLKADPVFDLLGAQWATASTIQTEGKTEGL
jgi:hypothetical protein